MRKFIDYRMAGIVFAIAGAMSTQACGEDGTPGLPGGDALLEECGLVCASEGIAEGNASISGIPNIDAFFSAVVNFNSKANLIAGNIDAELAKIRASVGAEANADIEAAIVAKFKLDADAGVKIAYEPAKCAVSAKATLEATAKCDASVDPGKASVECKGSCEASADVEASCDAEATVKCTGTAPELSCEGTCKGGCELEAAATCEGTCKGTCSGTCSATNAMGQCEGSCDGMCEGTCETTASVECSGKCKGECTYTPPDGKCEAGASVKCEAKADASVQCQGKCEGEFEPPMAKAECQASAKAEASVNVECTPPSIGVSYQFSAAVEADVDAKAQAQAEMEAFLVSFKASMSVIVAQLAQGELVVKAGAEIGEKGVDAVTTAVEDIDVTASLKVGVGVTCALAELPKVAGAMKASTDSLAASVEAAGELTASLGGS